MEKIELKGKRAQLMITEKQILVALRMQCHCKVSCNDRWTKQAIRNARENFFTLSKSEQLQRVYDILLAARNVETKEILLTIEGKVMISCMFNTQGTEYVGRHTWPITGFPPINFIPLCDMWTKVPHPQQSMEIS